MQEWSMSEVGDLTQIYCIGKIPSYLLHDDIIQYCHCTYYVTVQYHHGTSCVTVLYYHLITSRILYSIMVCVCGWGQTSKKSQACKCCLRTIFEKIMDIFGWTMIYWQFLPINGHKFALFLHNQSIFIQKYPMYRNILKFRPILYD